MCEVILRSHLDNIWMEKFIEWSFLPACSMGTAMTAACVVPAQPWPVTDDQRLTLNDTKFFYTADGNCGLI